jgi:hypothetical protein
MGKRSEFPRIEKDNYETPATAVEPLLRFLAPETRFIEPCCGAGCLAGHLKRAGHVLVGAFDLPDDARSKRYGVERGVLLVTNPPYHGRPADLHPLIINLSDQAPTWLLLPGDWLFNRSSAPLTPRLRLVIAIGRVRWIADSPHSSKDNYAWMLFERPSAWATVRFVGRAAAAMAPVMQTRRAAAG